MSIQIHTNKIVILNRTNSFYIILFFSSFVLLGQDLKVMTYNIKYDNKKDSVNNWNDRKEAMVELLEKYRPSFIGMQEVLLDQLEYLDEALPKYESIGVGRDDGKQKGEFSPILYNSQKYKLLQSSTFWLSKTPKKVSVGWDAAMERICTYGLFEDQKTKINFWVFNTHFDHIGIKARKNSAKLILKKIKDINTDKFPVVLMGDFNLKPGEKPVQLIKRYMHDGLDFSKTLFQGPKGSFNGFDTEAPIDARIDYIFVKGFDVESYIHIDERMDNGKHISDHLPVLINIAPK